MNIGKRIVAGASVAALACGVLVGTSSAAHAAVGDTSLYSVGPGGSTPDLEDVVVGPDGLLWAWDSNDSEFLKINASGEVQGIVPGEDCSSSSFKISFSGALWCFDSNDEVTRIYADGRRTLFTMPDLFDNAVDYEDFRAAVGPDGQLWVIAPVRLATLNLDTNAGNRRVTTDAAVMAVPMSAEGAFGAPITLNVRQGNFERLSSYGERVSLVAGPNNLMYFAWNPGHDIFSGQTTNVYGNFTTDGVISSQSEVGSPETIGMSAGMARSNGGKVYVFGKKYRSVVATTQDANGNSIPIVATVSGREVRTTNSVNDYDGTMSVFTSGNTVSRQDLQLDTKSYGNGRSNFVVDQQGNFWAATADDEAARFTTAGVVSPRAEMPGTNDAEAVVIGPDGNAWVAAEDFLVRVLTGAVPTNAAAPTLSQVDGITVGTPISGTSGEWNDPSGTYEYQWQVCSSNDASTCTDIPGATAAQYTPSTADNGKYVRMASYATSPNGRSEPAYSGLVAVGTPTATAPGAAVKATGSTAVIGNAQTMELDVPRKTKRGKKKLYEVFFTATDVPGTVTFTFKRRSKVKTVTVPIEDGIAEYRWRTPRKWPRGKTRVTATYVPSAGSPYTAAAVTDRVKVRGR